jgi:hypothetical protein
MKASRAFKHSSILNSDLVSLKPGTGQCGLMPDHMQKALASAKSSSRLILWVVDIESRSMRHIYAFQCIAMLLFL